MKLILILLLGLFSLEASEITFTKKFEKKVSPETLTLNFSINANMPNEKAVIKKLNFFYENLIKESKLKIEGGSFNVYPNYRYVNNKRVLDGYRGTVSYVVKSKDKEVIDDFLEEVYSLKHDSRVSISVGNIRWIVDREQHSAISDSLREDAIIWSYTYANTLSAKLSKECTLLTLNINAPHYQPRPPVRAMMAKNSAMIPDESFAPTPQQTDTPFSINPTFVLECR